MKIIAKNRRAYYDYEIQETFIAGIALFGHEVKSIKNGNIDLKGSYVTFHNGEVFLLNAHVKKYKHSAEIENYDPTRSRKLLLHKKEINKLHAYKQKGFTIIPLRVMEIRGFIKIEIAPARGKKKYDKRETIKKREQERRMKKSYKT